MRDMDGLYPSHVPGLTSLLLKGINHSFLGLYIFFKDFFGQISQYYMHLILKIYEYNSMHQSDQISTAVRILKSQ